jgi:hypothetical protein
VIEEVEVSFPSLNGKERRHIASHRTFHSTTNNTATSTTPIPIATITSLCKRGFDMVRDNDGKGSTESTVSGTASTVDGIIVSG